MRTKLFVLLMLASILFAGCASEATPAPTTESPVAATDEPVVATEEPVVATEETVIATEEPPAAEPVTQKIYLLDYSPDTI